MASSLVFFVMHANMGGPKGHINRKILYKPWSLNPPVVLGLSTSPDIWDQAVFSTFKVLIRGPWH